MTGSTIPGTTFGQRPGASIVASGARPAAPAFCSRRPTTRFSDPVSTHLVTDHILAEARSRQRRMIVLAKAAGARGAAHRTRALRALATAHRLCAIPILGSGARLVSHGRCAFCRKL